MNDTPLNGIIRLLHESADEQTYRQSLKHMLGSMKNVDKLISDERFVGSSEITFAVPLLDPDLARLGFRQFASNTMVIDMLDPIDTKRVFQQFILKPDGSIEDIRPSTVRYWERPEGASAASGASAGTADSEAASAASGNVFGPVDAAREIFKRHTMFPLCKIAAENVVVLDDTTREEYTALPKITTQDQRPIEFRKITLSIDKQFFKVGETSIFISVPMNIYFAHPDEDITKVHGRIPVELVFDPYRVMLRLKQGMQFGAINLTEVIDTEPIVADGKRPIAGKPMHDVTTHCRFTSFVYPRIWLMLMNNGSYVDVDWSPYGHRNELTINTVQGIPKFPIEFNSGQTTWSDLLSRLLTPPIGLILAVRDYFRVHDRTKVTLTQVALKLCPGQSLERACVNIRLAIAREDFVHAMQTHNPMFILNSVDDIRAVSFTGLRSLFDDRVTFIRTHGNWRATHDGLALRYADLTDLDVRPALDFTGVNRALFVPFSQAVRRVAKQTLSETDNAKIKIEANATKPTFYVNINDPGFTTAAGSRALWMKMLPLHLMLRNLYIKGPGGEIFAFRSNASKSKFVGGQRATSDAKYTPEEEAIRQRLNEMRNQLRDPHHLLTWANDQRTMDDIAHYNQLYDDLIRARGNTRAVTFVGNKSAEVSPVDNYLSRLSYGQDPKIIEEELKKELTHPRVDYAKMSDMFKYVSTSDIYHVMLRQMLIRIQCDIFIAKVNAGPVSIDALKKEIAMSQWGSVKYVTIMTKLRNQLNAFMTPATADARITRERTMEYELISLYDTEFPETVATQGKGKFARHAMVSSSGAVDKVSMIIKYMFNTLSSTAEPGSKVGKFREDAFAILDKFKYTESIINGGKDFIEYMNKLLALGVPRGQLQAALLGLTIYVAGITDIKTVYIPPNGSIETSIEEIAVQASVANDAHQYNQATLLYRYYTFLEMLSNKDIFVSPSMVRKMYETVEVPLGSKFRLLKMTLDSQRMSAPLGANTSVGVAGMGARPDGTVSATPMGAWAPVTGAASAASAAGVPAVPAVPAGVPSVPAVPRIPTVAPTGLGGGSSNPSTSGRSSPVMPGTPVADPDARVRPEDVKFQLIVPGSEVLKASYTKWSSFDPDEAAESARIAADDRTKNAEFVASIRAALIDAGYTDPLSDHDVKTIITYLP